MQGSRAGRPLFKRRYPYLALSLLIFLVVLAVWASVAPAAGVPTLTSRERATFVFGESHALAIKTDGSLWALGANDSGQLGTGDTVEPADFVRVGIDSDWTTVAAGIAHSLALKADGSLWAWGSNKFGQLGDGSAVSHLAPVRIGSDTDWVTVYASGDHSMAIKADGSLWCWGEGGQLGDGTTQNSLRPTRIGNSNDWLSVYTGWFHTLALKTDGSLWAWGDNETGQLGDGTTVDRLVPTRIGTSNNWVAASAGFFHSLGLMADGSLWGWGPNDFGMVGDGSTNDRSAPVRVGYSNDWARVSAGFVTSLAIKTDGSLWGWGKLNLTTGEMRLIPALVGSATKWADVKNGLLTAVGLKEDGTLVVWMLPVVTGVGVDLSTPVSALEGVRLPGLVPVAPPTTTTASTTTTTVPSTTSTTSTTTSTTTTSLPPAPTFADVPATHPYYAAISAMARKSIISGYPDGTFGPDKPVLRKHFAKMIVGAMGLPVTEADWQDSNPPFTDCGPDDPASLYPHDFIAVAKAHGLTAGKTATTFAPEANITRAQMVTMVVRAAQNSGISLKAAGADYAGPFKGYDDPIHGANVHLADYNGLLKGLATSGDPASWMAGNATRGEVAQVLWNLMQMVP